MLFHDTTFDLYYCITFDREDRVMSYRLDRILYDVYPVSGKHFKHDRGPEIERLRHVWGTGFENDVDPVHVKLEIKANTSNIVNKIRNDVRDRAYGKLRKEKLGSMRMM